jgi:hypothetical protein
VLSLAEQGDFLMDQTYWTEREQAEREMVRGAVSSQARLIHLKLARRYGAEAARSNTLTAGADPPIETGREIIAPNPKPSPPSSIFRPLKPDRPADPIGEKR